MKPGYEAPRVRNESLNIHPSNSQAQQLLMKEHLCLYKLMEDGEVPAGSCIAPFAAALLKAAVDFSIGRNKKRSREMSV